MVKKQNIYLALLYLSTTVTTYYIMKILYTRSLSLEETVLFVVGVTVLITINHKLNTQKIYHY